MLGSGFLGHKCAMHCLQRSHDMHASFCFVLKAQRFLAQAICGLEVQAGLPRNALGLSEVYETVKHAMALLPVLISPHANKIRSRESQTHWSGLKGQRFVYFSPSPSNACLIMASFSDVERVPHLQW